MHVLFVHQNCPAQFKDVAPALVKRGYQCTFLTTNRTASPGEGVRKVMYRTYGPVRQSNEITQSFLNETAHARGVLEAMKRTPDCKPDVIVAHSGFGGSLFLPHVDDAPIVNFFEYFFRPGERGQHLAYRKDTPMSEAALLRARIRNGGFLLDLNNCTRGWCPNRTQRDTLPAEYHSKIDVIPEGMPRSGRLRGRENWRMILASDW